VEILVRGEVQMGREKGGGNCGDSGKGRSANGKRKGWMKLWRFW